MYLSRATRSLSPSLWILCSRRLFMDTGIPGHIARYCGHAMRMLAAAALLAFAGIDPVMADHSVVLIAARGSGIEEISDRDVRRIFLGLKSTDSDRIRKPVINRYNSDLYESFLKNVMRMTEGTYKRKIVKRIFRHGTEEILEVGTLEELNEHLTTHVGDISFVDSSAIENMRDIEVVKVLW